MRSVPVVAVPVSQLKCGHCAQPLESFKAQHVCPQCGAPQPLSAADTYFSVLGVSPNFGLDASVLEKHFYEVLRVLHPDRFTTFASDLKALSLDRMSFVNRAYTTLKDPTLRRDYLLEVKGFKTAESKTSSSLPAELAEEWFEVQELLLEDPAEARKRLLEFESNLEEFKNQLLEKLAGWERGYDLTQGSGELEKLASGIQTLNYLNSMQRNVERIKANAHPN